MRLDIVIPAFNEEERIDRTLRAYRSVVTEPRDPLSGRPRLVHRRHRRSGT